MHAQTEMLIMRPDLIIRPEMITLNEEDDDFTRSIPLQTVKCLPNGDFWNIDDVVLEALVNRLDQTCMRGLASDDDSYSAEENNSWLDASSLQVKIGFGQHAKGWVKEHTQQTQCDSALDVPAAYDQQIASTMIGDDIFHPQVVSSSSKEFSGAAADSYSTDYDMQLDIVSDLDPFASPASGFHCYTGASDTSRFNKFDDHAQDNIQEQTSPLDPLYNVGHSSSDILPDRNASFFNLKATTITAGMPTSYDSHAPPAAHYLVRGEKNTNCRPGSTDGSGKRKRETIMSDNPNASNTNCSTQPPKHKGSTSSEDVVVVSTTRTRKAGTKRTRAAETHNEAERSRRSLINERLRALQEVIPNSNKTDKASLLTEAINYLVKLRLQLQLLNQVVTYKNAFQRIQRLHASQAAMGSTLSNESNIGGSPTTTVKASPCGPPNSSARLTSAPIQSVPAVGPQLYHGSQRPAISTTSQFPHLPMSTPSCPKVSTALTFHNQSGSGHV